MATRTRAAVLSFEPGGSRRILQVRLSVDTPSGGSPVRRITRPCRFHSRQHHRSRTGPCRDHAWRAGSGPGCPQNVASRTGVSLRQSTIYVICSRELKNQSDHRTRLAGGLAPEGRRLVDRETPVNCKVFSVSFIPYSLHASIWGGPLPPMSR